MELQNFFAPLLCVFAVLSACQSYSLPYNPPSTAPCGPVCAIYCPAGNVLDERGCPTCRCKPEPTDTYTSPYTACPALGCAAAIYCPNGFELDSRGCQTCSCKSGTPFIPFPVCPAIRCANYCPNGFQRDSRGCDTCTCQSSTPPNWLWDDQKECNYNRCYRQCVQGKTKALPCNCDCSKFPQ